MFSLWRGPSGLTNGVRNIFMNMSLRDAQKVTTDVKKPEHIPVSGKVHQRISDWDRKILVWTKRYKTLEDIPHSVPLETIEKAKSYFRIKLANYMMLATILGCLAYAISGKRAASRGESVSKMNMDWHKQIAEEGKQK